MKLNDAGLSLADVPKITYRAFRVQVLTAINDWVEDYGIPASEPDQYGLADKLWDLWVSVVAMQKTLERMNDGT